MKTAARKIRRHTVARVLSAVAITTALPMAFTPKGAVALNACAAVDVEDGSCCPAFAVCGLHGENYEGMHYVAGSCS